MSESLKARSCRIYPKIAEHCHFRGTPRQGSTTRMTSTVLPEGIRNPPGLLRHVSYGLAVRAWPGMMTADSGSALLPRLKQVDVQNPKQTEWISDSRNSFNGCAEPVKKTRWAPAVFYGHR